MRHPLETLQLGNLRLKLGDGLCCCRAVHKPILVRLQFLAIRFLKIVLIQNRLQRRLRNRVARLSA